LKKIKDLIDITLLKYLSVFYIIIVLVRFIRYSYLKITSFNKLLYYTSWPKLVLDYIIIDWIIVIIAMVVISVITKRMLKSDKKHLTGTTILIHFLISIFFVWFFYSVRALSGYYLLSHVEEGELLNALSYRQFFISLPAYFNIYVLMVALIYAYHYINRVKNIAAQKSQLETQLAETKLNALKSQLHPHFMFNTLNSISTLMEKDVHKAQDLIADFGDLFRSIIESDKGQMIQLKDEISFLNKYIEIISVRFSDHLKVNVEIEKDIDDYKVPNMLIQPIVENAIKHGYSYANTELAINILIFKQKDYLHIRIENDGALLISDFDKLINRRNGLKITEQRLKTRYKEDYQFYLRNRLNAKGVESFIKIPLIK